MKTIKNLCLIPARGGSKRIIKKNIKLFCGKPILAYSIEKAIDSGIFDEIIVSTDNEEIAEIAKKYGAKVPYIRSEKNSDDFATISDVIVEVIENYQKDNINIINICVTFPTIPLLNSEYFSKGFEYLNTNTVDSVLTIKKYRHPIERALHINIDNNLEFIDQDSRKFRTQDLEVKYYDAGQIYFFRREIFEHNKDLLAGKNIGIVLNFLESVDIDSEEDWNLAEILFKTQHFIDKT